MCKKSIPGGREAVSLPAVSFWFHVSPCRDSLLRVANTASSPLEPGMLGSGPGTEEVGKWKSKQLALQIRDR